MDEQAACYVTVSYTHLNSPVNDLKLRIGYGVTGNQEIGTDIPVCIHLERGSPLFPQRRPVPYILSSPVSGSKPQPGEQVDQRHLPRCV